MVVIMPDQVQVRAAGGPIWH